MWPAALAEASHHEVSMQMAELSLLPAVREQPDAIVVADGTSCRHQIHDGAGRDAIHVGAAAGPAARWVRRPRRPRRGIAQWWHAIDDADHPPRPALR